MGQEFESLPDHLKIKHLSDSPVSVFVFGRAIVEQIYEDTTKYPIIKQIIFCGNLYHLASG